MKVSIIVPVYNMEKDDKLKFCLDSLLEQTIDDYEIIAVDDASSDASPAILKQYEKEYPQKIRTILKTENGRQGSAKNDGLRIAEGEWISFIDSDDWVAPDFYEKLLKKAVETGADVVGCNYSIVYEHTFKVGYIVDNNNISQAGVLDAEKHKNLFNHFGSMVVKIYRRNVIKENDLSFPDGIFYEDNCAGPLWSTYFSHFEFVDEALYYYFQNSESTVHNININRLYDRMTACEILLEEMKNRNKYEMYKDELEYVFTITYFKNTLFSYMLSKHQKGIAFVRELKRKMLGYFPDFTQGKYYEIPDAEEKRMIDLLMRNTFVFYVYYSALWMYRRKIRKVK